MEINPISPSSHTHAHTHTQNIIQENPFTDTLRTGSASPTLSIGEAIDGPADKMISNPFMADQAAGRQQAQQWEMYRRQVRGNREWGEREVGNLRYFADGGTDAADAGPAEAREGS